MLNKDYDSENDKFEEANVEKRPQFGARHLKIGDDVYCYNAWDNVEMDEDQLQAAEMIVSKQMVNRMSLEEFNKIEVIADHYWDAFYSKHNDKFYKDRHWLFTEFPELADGNNQFPVRVMPSESNQKSELCMATEAIKHSYDSPLNLSQNLGTKLLNDTVKSTKDILIENLNNETDSSRSSSYTVNENNICEYCSASEDDASSLKQKIKIDISPNNIISSVKKISTDIERTNIFKCSNRVLSDAKVYDIPHSNCSSHAEYKPKIIFELGCGVGNTIFPILQYSQNPLVKVYGCDFSDRAINILNENTTFGSRCHAFVCDITQDQWSVPFAPCTIDIVIMIYVLSSINPNKMTRVLQNAYKYLKPGGLILFRDYGRYDMSQLRFKNGRCITDNFYARGEGTFVYFFEKQQIGNMFEECGYETVQLLCDKRLQVNRKRQLKMYRVWIQGKFRKPFSE